MNRDIHFKINTVDGTTELYTLCPLCHKKNFITVKRGKAKENRYLAERYYAGGELVQDVFTDSKCEEVYEEDATLVREFFISGICDKCFKEMEAFEDELEEEVEITSDDLKEYMMN